MSPASCRVGVRIGGLRSYLGFEDGVGDEIVDSRHLPCLPVALQGFYPVEQSSRRRVLHEQRHRDVDAEALLDPAGELRGGQRVPAEVEEVVLGLDLALIQAQHVFPGPREQRLLLPAGGIFGEPGDVTRLLSGGSGRRGREFGAVDLARGSLNGERLQLDEDGGNRVVRQAVLQDAPYLLAASRLRVEAPARVAFVVLGVGHDIGDEAFILALFAFGDDDAGSHGEALLDGGLDGAELDAVAPDLDHKVHAAHDLQTPVGEDARPVARAVHPGAIRRRRRDLRGSSLPSSRAGRRSRARGNHRRRTAPRPRPRGPARRLSSRR